MGAVAWTARSTETTSATVFGLGACFVPYAGLLLFSRALPGKRALDQTAFVTALIFGLGLVLAPPLLSDDLYRYLWEGRLWLEGFNPYQLAPDDPGLASLRDDVWSKVNNESLATIYPPLSQLLFLVAQWLGGQVWMFKLLALGIHLLSVAVAARVCTRSNAALALGLNPLLLSEAALNGHFDIACGVALLVAAYALSRQRFVRAGVAVCVAVGLKVVGVVLLPLFAARPKVLVATGLGSTLLLVPLVWSRAPADPVSGSGQFAMRWRGNESLFALIDRVCRGLFESDVGDIAARVVTVTLLLVLCAFVVHRRVPPGRAARALVWAVLLLSPQVHPWYLAWLLPLEIAAGGVAGLVWSAVALCAYAPIDRWVAEGVWRMPVWLQIFEYSVVALALILDPRRPNLSTTTPEREFPL